MNETEEVQLALEKLDVIVPYLLSIRARRGKKEYYKYLYNLIDEYNYKSGIEKEIQCTKQECSFCCHDLIVGSKEEIETLSKFIKDNDMYINTENIQNRDTWNNLSFKQQACPLLKDGKCSAYEHRPIICRKHNIRKGQDFNICKDKDSAVESVILMPTTYFMVGDMALNSNNMKVLNFELLGQPSSISERLIKGKFTT